MSEREKGKVVIVRGDGLLPFIDNAKTGVRGILNDETRNTRLTIVLCGVGCKAIIDILGKMKLLPKHVKVESIITSPANTKPSNVRELYRGLAKLGFGVDGISLDVERGRFYIGTKFEKLDVDGDQNETDSFGIDNENCDDISFFAALCNKLQLDKYTCEKVIEWEDHHRRWELMDKRYKSE